MKIFIHVGMHKTGSSSIQNTFSAIKGREDFLYLPWEGPNHSGLFVLLFEDPARSCKSIGFRKQGLTEENMRARRLEWFRKTNQALSRTKAKTVLLSAESICGPFDTATRRLHAFCREKFDAVQVIGYVRDPASYMASAFQEIVKTGNLPRLDPAPIWPHYRRAFEKLDRYFGKENVKLKFFDKKKLVNGSVVDDIAHEMVIIPDNREAIFSNESLSLEATALLFVQRKLGDGFVEGLPQVHKYNWDFVHKLSHIGETKFMFSREFVQAARNQFKDDVDWIQTRMGEEFPESGFVPASPSFGPGMSPLGGISSLPGSSAGGNRGACGVGTTSSKPKLSEPNPASSLSGMRLLGISASSSTAGIADAGGDTGVISCKLACCTPLSPGHFLHCVA